MSTARAIIPVSDTLRDLQFNAPEEYHSVTLQTRDITSANLSTLVESIRDMPQTKSVSQVGGIVNFQIKGKHIDLLPKPEGVRYKRPSRACTQQVQEMVNPETGETRMARNGCEIADLRKAGWVPVGGEGAGGGGNGGGNGGSNGGGNGGSTEAGVSGSTYAFIGGGLAVAAGLMVMSS